MQPSSKSFSFPPLWAMIWLYTRIQLIKSQWEKVAATVWESNQRAVLLPSSAIFSGENGLHQALQSANGVWARESGVQTVSFAEMNKQSNNATPFPFRYAIFLSTPLWNQFHECLQIFFCDPIPAGQNIEATSRRTKTQDKIVGPRQKKKKIWGNISSQANAESLGLYDRVDRVDLGFYTSQSSHYHLGCDNGEIKSLHEGLCLQPVTPLHTHKAFLQQKHSQQKFSFTFSDWTTPNNTPVFQTPWQNGNIPVGLKQAADDQRDRWGAVDCILHC